MIPGICVHLSVAMSHLEVRQDSQHERKRVEFLPFTGHLIIFSIHCSTLVSVSCYFEVRLCFLFREEIGRILDCSPHITWISVKY